MKKMLIILSVVLSLALAGNVMAVPDWENSDFYYHTVTGKITDFPNGTHPGNNTQWIPCTIQLCGGDIPEPTGDQNVTGSAEAISFNSDESRSSTGRKGNRNDFGESYVEGWASGYTENFASGDRYAHQESFAKANPVDVNAWSWSKDYGLTSKAGAGAKLDGSRCDVLVTGFGYGLGGDKEFSYTKIGLGGFGSQANMAGEEGYNSGFAIGGNVSEFSFQAYNEKLSEGQSGKWWIFPIPGSVALGFGINGEAITKGKTEVSIDPYGHNRSAYATTQNMTSVNVNADVVRSRVSGNGFVEAGISGYGGYAGGSATFNYSGQFTGSGNATTYNSVNNTSNGTSAVSHSSSSAFADGFNVPN